MGQIDLRFADETAFNLVPNVPYGWMRQGEQKSIPSRKGGNLNVFGLLNLKGDLTSYQTTARVDAQTVIEWLDNFAHSIVLPTVVLIDNAPWHTATNVVDKIEEWEELGLFLVYLPPYSPHLNLIEILWRKMKYEWLKPEHFENKEALHQAINHILRNYNTEQFNIDFTIQF